MSFVKTRTGKPTTTEPAGPQSKESFGCRSGTMVNVVHYLVISSYFTLPFLLVLAVLALQLHSSCPEKKQKIAVYPST